MLKYIGFFAAGVLIFLLIRKRRMAVVLFAFSFLVLSLLELLPFLASSGILESSIDSAKLSYFREVNSCPQFQRFSYWQQTWFFVGLYFVFCLLILSRNWFEKSSD